MYFLKINYEIFYKKVSHLLKLRENNDNKEEMPEKTFELNNVFSKEFYILEI